MKKLRFLFLGILFTLCSSFALKAKGLPDEYYKIRDINKSKQYFFDYLYELIKQENDNILAQRAFVKNYLSSNLLSINFNSPDFLYLLELKKKYKVKKLLSADDYLKRIDVVPPSMALAQAAVESGWGKSRFIKEANNIFGHWTYNPRIGMMPENRDEGARHFIRIFKSLQDSISAYMLNLNRNLAYKQFQNERLEQREKNINPEGLSLSQTMVNYSGIGHDYLSILKNVIEKNNLKEYDKKFYKKN